MPWFSRCFATIGNVWLVFLQWLNKTKDQKPKKNKKAINQKKQKNTNHKNKTHKKHDKTQLSATTPSHWGVQSCFFFVSCFFGFLFSSSLLVFSAMAKYNQKPKNQETKKNEKPKKQKTKKKKTKWQDPILCHYFPPLGCAILFFFLFLVFLVSCFLVHVGGFLKG